MEQSLELRSTYPAAAPHSHLGVPLCSPLRSPPRWSLPSLGEAQEWIPPKRLGEAPHHLPHVLMVGSKGIPAQQAFQREARGLFRLRENGSEIFQTPVFNIPWGSVSKIFNRTQLGHLPFPMNSDVLSPSPLSGWVFEICFLSAALTALLHSWVSLFLFLFLHLFQKYPSLAASFTPACV